MIQQLVLIHGGNTFNKYESYLQHLNDLEYDPYIQNIKWKDILSSDLGDAFDVIQPKMPNSQNAKYLEWNIWFEKIIPFMRTEITLVGHSLGGIFLAKYLSENTLPIKIKSLHLIAAPFDDKDCDYEMADFVLMDSLKNIELQCSNIHLYHSEDDFVVPFVDLQKYVNALPSATAHIFKNRNHFLIESFPELLDNIR